MIDSIKNYYNAPSPCLDLCVPLQKYHAFFADRNEELTGFSKVALTVAWIATAFFAYPIFGLLAAVGVAIKAASGQQEEVDPMDMTDEELQIWKGKASIEEWNQAQILRLKFCFALPLPDSASFVGEGGSSLFQQNPECVYSRWCVADSPKITLDQLREEVMAEMQPFIDAGKRIELSRIYERGGPLDAACTGRIYVFGCVEGGNSPLPASAARSVEAPSAPRRSVGNSVVARDPIKMGEVELRAWGEGPSVTVQQWNDVQWKRIGKFLLRGVEGNLKGLPRWDGPVTEEDPSSWQDNPWKFPAYDGWCFLLERDQHGAGCNGLDGLSHDVKAVLDLATADGKKVQARYLYQSTENSSAVARVQCRRINS